MSHVVVVGNANRLLALPTVWWLPTVLVAANRLVVANRLMAPPTNWWHCQQFGGKSGDLDKYI
jgi:hypothetical protein